MSASNDEQPVAPRGAGARLGAVIAERRDEIARRWLERTSRGAAPAGGPEQARLRDRMEAYLDRLAALLGGAATDARHSWRDHPPEAGARPRRSNLDISRTTRELVALRHVVREIAAEHGVPMDGAEARLADVLDEAIVDAVQVYVEGRDLERRRNEAERMSFLTHELRNPLGTATLAATLLRRHLGAEHEVEIDRLERSHRRLRDVIDGVLLTEQLAAGQLDSHPFDITLGQIIDQSLEIAQTTAAQRGLTLRVRYDAGLRVHVDPLLTRAALQNLAESAVRRSGEGGVEIAIEERQGALIIHVSDTSRGLSPQAARFIDEPSMDAGDAPLEWLSLAIARRAVEAQGGSLEVEAQGASGGPGCHFWITLPQEAAAPAAPEV